MKKTGKLELAIICLVAVVLFSTSAFAVLYAAGNDNAGSGLIASYYDGAWSMLPSLGFYDVTSIALDLDGTLLDNKQGIVNSFNYALKKFNLSPLEPLEIEKMIGIPLDEMFARPQI